MAKTFKKSESSINAFNKLKESNNKKKKWIWGLSTVALLSLISTTAMVFVSNNNVSASETINNNEDTNNKIESLEKSNKELQELVTKLESNKLSLEEKIVKYTNDKDQLNNEITNLRKNIVDNQSVIGSLSNQVSILDTQISELREEKQRLENENSSNNVRLEELNDIISDLEKERDDLLLSINEKETIISDYENQVVSYENQVEELQGIIDSLNEGRTSISVENDEMFVSSLDFNYFRYYKDDVVSLDSKGNSIDFVVFDGGTTHTENGMTKTLYYINGTPDNGAYAIRTIYEKTDSPIVVKDVERYSRQNVGYEININNFEYELDSVMVDTDDIQSVRINVRNITENTNVATLNSNNPTYKFDTESLYSVNFNFTVRGTQYSTIESFVFYVNTSNNPVLSIQDHIFSGESYSEVLSTEVNDENFVMTFKMFDDSETVNTLTISNESIKQIANGDKLQFDDGDITVSENLILESYHVGGTSYYTNSFNIHLRTTDGSNNGYITFDFDMMVDLVKKQENGTFGNASFELSDYSLPVDAEFVLQDNENIVMNLNYNGSTISQISITGDMFNQMVLTEALCSENDVNNNEELYLSNTYLIKESENTLIYGGYFYEKDGTESGMTEDDMGKNAQDVILGVIHL